MLLQTSVKLVYGSTVKQISDTAQTLRRWGLDEALLPRLRSGNVRGRLWSGRPAVWLAFTIRCAALPTGVGFEKSWAGCAHFGSLGTPLALRSFFGKCTAACLGTVERPRIQGG